MPTYNFTCNQCQKPFEIFLLYSEYGKTPVHCPHCQSQNVRRLLTKVRIAKSEESRFESAADELDSLAGMEDNPQALARAMRKMGEQAGEDLPPEFNEMTKRLEAGQSPAEIEKDLPELGADSAD